MGASGNHDEDSSTVAFERLPSASFGPELFTDAPRLRRASAVDPMDFLPEIALPANAWVPHGPAARCDAVVATAGAATVTVGWLPPSHFDVTTGADEVIVVLGMDEAHRSVACGIDAPFATLAIGWPGTRCVAHWPIPSGTRQSFAVVALPVDRAPCEWPRAEDLFAIREVSVAAMARLRGSLRDQILSIAHEHPPIGADAAHRRCAALIEEIGDAFRGSSAVPVPPALVTKGYLQLIDRIDDHIVDNFAERIRLEDVAEALRVSRRTIHNVMMRIRGVTFQEHLRTLRLRCVRFCLLHDGSIHLVKQAAMRYGFVHQGRFAQDYAEHFGETPSQTLERGTRSPRGRPMRGT